MIDFNFVGILSLAVGFGALGTTIIIAHRQGKQTDELSSVTEEIHNMTSKQTKLMIDTRDFYGAVFVGYVRLLSDQYRSVINLYEKQYKEKPRNSQKEEARQTLKKYYDDLLTKNFPKIESIELVKVFGKEIAKKHWTYTIKITSSSRWQPNDDNGMKLMINSFIEQMQELIDLKDEFLPYCDKAYKNDESCYKQKYKFIKDMDSY